MLGKGEVVGVADPASDRGPSVVLVIRADVDVGRRAWAAREVFVAAADGEVGVRGFEIDGNSAGQHGKDRRRQERTYIMSSPGDVGDVPSLAGSVIDKRQINDADVRLDCWDQLILFVDQLNLWAHRGVGLNLRRYRCRSENWRAR